MADRQLRLLRQPPLLEIEEQFLPVLLALTEAVHDGDQFLPAFGRGPHEDEQALLLIALVFQPHVDVNTVGPDVDELLAQEVTAVPFLVFLAPLLLETDDDFGTEALGVLAEQCLQGFGVIACRDTLQIEPRDQLLDAPALPQIGRQDRRREDHSLIDAPRLVLHPRLLDLERPRARHDGPGREVTVSNNLLPATLIRSASVFREEGVYFALQGSVEYLPGSLTDIGV